MICTVIGDSIAAGIAWAMPECHAQVKPGITSTRYLQNFPLDIGGDLAVISLGANDWHLGTYQNLHRIRAGITAARVVWLLPNIQRAGVRDAIQHIRSEFGDGIIDTAPIAGHDTVHPTMSGYRLIANETRQMARS